LSTMAAVIVAVAVVIVDSSFWQNGDLPSSNYSAVMMRSCLYQEFTFLQATC